jgi:hypothetical protein
VSSANWCLVGLPDGRYKLTGFMASIVHRLFLAEQRRRLADSLRFSSLLHASGKYTLYPGNN